MYVSMDSFTISTETDGLVNGYEHGLSWPSKWSRRVLLQSNIGFDPTARGLLTFTK